MKGYLYTAGDMLLTTLADAVSGNKVSGNSSNAVNNFARFITLLLIFILVLVVCYYTTRFVAKSQKGLRSGGNLELMESISLGGNRYLQLVKAGGHFMVLALGKDSVQLICELQPDEVHSVARQEGGFLEILKRAKEKSEDKNERDKT